MGKLKNGQKVRDSITGFEGVITGHADYISGCEQYLVQPAVDEKGAFVNSLWFDEQRLDFVKEKTVRLVNKKAGADLPAPIK